MLSNLQVNRFIFFVGFQFCFLNCDTVKKHSENNAIEKPVKIGNHKQVKEQISLVDSLEKNITQQPDLEKDPNSYPIVGVWLLTKFHTNTIEILEARTPQITISLTAMRVNGTDGCNSIGGSILSFKNDRIKFDNIVRTKKLCEIRYDVFFLSLLAETRKFKVKESDNLFLLNKDGNVLLEFDFNFVKAIF